MFGQRYLVDTGAQISVIPASHFDRFNHKLTHLLVAANGTSIKTYGTSIVPLNFNQRNFQRCFTVADVAHPLLGADFLQVHSLLVDLKGRRLVDAEMFSSVPLTISTVSAPELGTIAASSNRYHKLLAQYPQISRPEFSTPTMKYGVEHYIPTKVPPTHARARRLAPDKLRIAKEEFRKMEDMGIVRVIQSMVLPFAHGSKGSSWLETLWRLPLPQ